MIQTSYHEKGVSLDMFQATTDPVAGSLLVSALVACLPLLTFFIALAGFKLKAHWSAVIALAVALIVAIVGFKMPVTLSLLSATQGAVYGFFPIAYIIVMAVWFYQITVNSGRFNDLRSFFDRIGGGDVRIQAILIAFCFGGLLEALAGFGAPVAITATMVLALGVSPIRAAMVCLICNTAPVAYGAAGTPITTAGNIVGGENGAETAQHIAALVGTQAPLFSFVVPVLACLVLDGKKGLKDCWLPALVTGISFGISQWWCSTHFSYELTDVVAALVSLGVSIAFMSIWKPKNVDAVRERFGLEPLSEVQLEKLPPVRAWMALLPYLIVIVVFGVCKLVTPIQQWLSSTDIAIKWPGLADKILNASGADPGTTYTFTWLSGPGTALLVSGLITAVVYSIFNGKGQFKISIGQSIAEIGVQFWKMRYSTLTIVLVLSLAYVMNFSGQTISIGQLLASTGAAFAFLSPILGWVGTAVTGSDTSANALFASLQYEAATNNAALQGVTPNLFLASNTIGGVVGKMISPQSLAIAAIATKETESTIFKKVLPWSIGFLVALCIWIYLQSSVLSGILPTG